MTGRVFLAGVGTLALALGILGVVVPLLPTTPFVLLAAGCYARAWPPAHRWIRSNRLFGPICRSGAGGRYLPRRAKAAAIVFVVASLGATATLGVKTWPWRIVLAAVAVAIVTFLLSLPSDSSTTNQ